LGLAKKAAENVATSAVASVAKVVGLRRQLRYPSTLLLHHVAVENVVENAVETVAETGRVVAQNVPSG